MDAIARAWNLPADVKLEEVPGGLINQTWIARRASDRIVIQKLHPVFGAEVNLDIDAVTRHAEGRVRVPRIVPTTSGALWLEDEGRIYRALSYQPGATIHRIAEPEQAWSAGLTAGAFHRAVDDLEYSYRFTRAGVHDTAAHLAKLATQEEAAGGPAEALSLACEILDAADDLPEIPRARKRHCHGDLKISNILFGGSLGNDGDHCLIDLDTVGRQTIAFELGDALRSWCNPRGEDTTRLEVDLDILAQAMAGYADGSKGLLEPEEIAGIAPGLVTVTLELAARFCVDAFEDSYFGWDAKRFGSRVEHNLTRARGQLALARSGLRHLDEAAQIITNALAVRP